VKWNVWVSGLWWSRSALRMEKSNRNRVMRSFWGIASHWLPPRLTALHAVVLPRVAWNK
jgi:hypothetical protein